MQLEKINLPIVEKGKSITINVNGKYETYKPIDNYRKENLSYPTILANAIIKYSTNSDPNISEKEIFGFKQTVIEETMVNGDIATDNFITSSTFKNFWLSSIERLINLYTDPSSDGGKDITPNEYTKFLYEMLETTGGIKKKESF